MKKKLVAYPAVDVPRPPDASNAEVNPTNKCNLPNHWMGLGNGAPVPPVFPKSPGTTITHSVQRHSRSFPRPSLIMHNRADISLHRKKLFTVVIKTRLPLPPQPGQPWHELHLFSSIRQ